MHSKYANEMRMLQMQVKLHCLWFDMVNGRVHISSMDSGHMLLYTRKKDEKNKIKENCVLHLYWLQSASAT